MDLGEMHFDIYSYFSIRKASHYDSVISPVSFLYLKPQSALLWKVYGFTVGTCHTLVNQLLPQGLCTLRQSHLTMQTRGQLSY